MPLLLAATSIVSFSRSWKQRTFRHRLKRPPRVLLRRLYYDVIGLPPTAEELDDFAADPSDARFEATVDRLLASPRFGERWGRYWLDVARYSDTKGYVFEEDRNYKGGFAYRDWVINSFNSDRPYDKFVVAQIAADQTGDATCAPGNWLPHARSSLSQQSDRHHQRPHRRRHPRHAGNDRRLRPLPRSQVRPDYLRPITTRSTACSPVAKKSRTTMRPPEMVDSAKPYDPYVFLRGSAGNRGPNTERRFLTALAPDHKPKPFEHGSGRLELANAIASRDNPLTARVWVNRVWDHLFGKGLVDTPSDFGIRGTLADTSRIARHARLRFHGRQLVDQTSHSPHRSVRHVSPVERNTRPNAWRPIPKTASCGVPIAADWIWKRFAIRC